MTKKNRCKRKGCGGLAPGGDSKYCKRCVRKLRRAQATAAEERKADKIRCKICGRWFVLLAAHTYPAHGLTGREYRKRFGYDVKKGLIPEHYRRARQALLRKRPEFLENIRGRGAPRFKKGEGGKYVRSVETLGRLTKSFDKTHDPSEETRERMRQARLGKRHSAETKKRIRQAKKKFWAGPGGDRERRRRRKAAMKKRTKR